MSAKAIKELTEKIEQLEKKVEQLYKAHYNPPTNHDLYKTLNDLSDRMNVALGSLKRLER
jgi:phage shock protein A